MLSRHKAFLYLYVSPKEKAPKRKLVAIFVSHLVDKQGRDKKGGTRLFSPCMVRSQIWLKTAISVGPTSLKWISIYPYTEIDTCRYPYTPILCTKGLKDTELAITDRSLCDKLGNSFQLQIVNSLCAFCFQNGIYFSLTTWHACSHFYLLFQNPFFAQRGFQKNRQNGPSAGYSQLGIYNSQINNLYIKTELQRSTN